MDSTNDDDEERGVELASYQHHHQQSSSQSHGLRNNGESDSEKATSPTVLTFNHITVTTRAKPHRVLLNDISGSITGGYWAILGASGGGKTTLLSTLSLRLDPAYMDIQGEFRLNGRIYSRQVLKAMSAYVMQDDLLHAELTVEETLSYAAQLRLFLSPTLTLVEKEQKRIQRINEVITLMELSHCRKTLIGNDRRKGISGGERKRVSIAIELLNHPKLLFLDEPTSGLDGQTAFAICMVLKNLASPMLDTKVGPNTTAGPSASPFTGSPSTIGYTLPECTVVCTIHQPQPKIFSLFDSVILMRKGMIVYRGSMNSLSIFLDECLGSPCPSDLPLADHVLEVIAPNSENELIENQEKIPVPVNLSLGSDKPFYDSDGK